MTLRLGDTAPDFQQESSEGTISFYDFLGNSWGILFSHPADYTPVCTTELGYTAKLKDEFEFARSKISKKKKHHKVLRLLKRWKSSIFTTIKV